MSNRISLEQALQAYRVMNAPAKFSWKKHWAQETFSSPDLLSCSEDEQQQFIKRLQECTVTICKGATTKVGRPVTLESVFDLLIDPNNRNIKKTDRYTVYGSSNGNRPVGDEAYDIWNGFQIIDIDIKDETRAKKLKYHIFKALHKCNWFMGVALSSSGMGLHVYTKITVPEDVDLPTMPGYNGANKLTDNHKRKVLYKTNFRHKFSFVYMACLSALEELEVDKTALESALSDAQKRITDLESQIETLTVDSAELILTIYEYMTGEKTADISKAMELVSTQLGITVTNPSTGLEGNVKQP